MFVPSEAHLNAYVPPASRDWSAHEWREGDFVRHFAGCPWQDSALVRASATLEHKPRFYQSRALQSSWQEPHCLGLMRETAKYADQELRRAS